MSNSASGRFSAARNRSTSRTARRSASRSASAPPITRAPRGLKSPFDSRTKRCTGRSTRENLRTAECAPCRRRPARSGSRRRLAARGGSIRSAGPLDALQADQHDRDGECHPGPREHALAGCGSVRHIQGVVQRDRDDVDRADARQELQESPASGRHGASHGVYLPRMSVERADERVTPNLPMQLVRGTDRDFLGVMIGVLMHAVLLASAAACQQGERRESAGDVAATVPMRPTPVSSFDDDVRAAQSELAEGRGWFATRRVAPALKDSVRRTPEAVLVAARAAAAWAGWDEVQKLLVDEPWLASRFSGEGHELLARSALERNDASGARTHAEAALRLASDQTARAIRMVLLARALDRLDVRDSAAGTYRRAADALPAVREWLLLRAAGSTADAKARERLYAGARGPATRARVPHTEAQTLERFRADLAAADAYEKLGDMPSAYRLRLQSSDQVQRSGIRAGLLGYIQRDARGGNLARALEVLDAAFPQLDPTSQLVVTRRAAEGGVSGRAMTGFARVPAALLTDADVISWARALIASGKPTEAASRIAARRFGAVAAPEAAYVRGLALVRAGRTTLARAALQRVTTSHASSPHAADALYLLADLESDAGRESRARDLFQRACVAKAPGSFSDEACFRAGILSYALGNARLAATAFDELPRRFPASQEVSAAQYWAGRAWERTGNAALARERWSAVLQREPLSYYASGSARRLGTKQWTPAPAQVPRSPRFQGR